MEVLYKGLSTLERSKTFMNFLFCKTSLGTVVVTILVVDVGLIVVRVAAEVVAVDKVAMDVVAMDVVAMVVVSMIVVVVDVVAVDKVAMDVVAMDVVAMVVAMVVVFTWSSLLLIVTRVATDTIVANMNITVRVRAHKVVKKET